ncbi:MULTISPECIES: type II toxin-antitoxin system RelE family toxin [unclassified Serratia (in: enterobacteria)]|uniref:type II toxin-antitoxin system RelE family toxin n=1 Tax=unclassified Serratia (in: enterobacteria) TaxID=2647522 RepID=UPI003075EEB9
MNCKVKFRTDAFKEWNSLDKSIQQQFARELKRCAKPSANLRNTPNYCVIKLQASGFRLVYQVINSEVIIAVVAVGQRKHREVYTLMSNRLK